MSEENNVDALEPQEQRTESKKRGLSADVKAKEPHKRVRIKCEFGNEENIDDDDSSEEDAVCNSAIGQVIVDEMICPITLELPFDPVTAGDGNVYERSAILKHIGNNSQSLRSPVSNAPMPSHLLPNPKVKNIIESAIDNGDIVGELADVWIEKRNNKQNVEAAKEAAQKGDSDAAAQIAYCYQFGVSGVTIDEAEARKWWKIASDGGHICGLVMRGANLMLSGNFFDVTEALALMAEAASRGSQLAQCTVGKFYALGIGFKKNDMHAVRWLLRAVQIKGDVLKFAATEELLTECKEHLKSCLSRLTESQRHALGIGPTDEVAD